MDVLGQDQTSDADRPVELLVTRTRRVRHERARLGQEILDDDLLDVAELAMEPSNRFESFESVLAGLTDAHEQTRREGNLQLTGESKRVQAPLGVLIGRETVGLERRE